ncbi:mitochondrial ribosomal protein subunit L20-domain-containing protein [Hypoxylon sp. FL0543]|nr:mitochondrial ribosomal protein subunit L20-domain-containing protein [Hypoxylon sp. FL0543]
MEKRALVQPLLRTIANSTSSTSRRAAATAVFIPQRQQSTTARTKRALKIPPHPSFLASASKNRGDLPELIYNPPAAAPSVYHTPFKFLPRSDPRRQANLSQLVHNNNSNNSPSATAPSSTSNLPPQLKHPPSKYNVTREQVEEMRQLRAEDSAKWTVLKLAERYGCSAYFVMMCCRATPEHRARERARLDAVKAGWGPIRSGAREERKKRKALLLRDAL